MRYQAILMKIFHQHAFIPRVGACRNERIRHPRPNSPMYLGDHYPPASASNVPTKTAISLRVERPVIGSQTQYSLKSLGGGTIPLTAGVYYNDVALRPSTLL